MQERTELKLACHGRKVKKFERSTPEIEGIMATTRWSSLITCSLETDNKGLLSTFAERWHKKTSSFYLLIRELTITLNDMASLLHLPITGAFHTFDAIDVEEGSDLLVELLKVNRQEANDETEQCRGTYGRLAWLQNIYRSKCDTRQWTVAAWAYLLHLVGCTLFANKSATHISVVFLNTFCDLGQYGGYSWGAAVLIHMYDNLNVASKHMTKYLARYITLLQIIIIICVIVMCVKLYMYYWLEFLFIFLICVVLDLRAFPYTCAIIADEDYHERKPRVCRWKFGKALSMTTYHKWLDRLMTNVVCWIPYGDHRAFR